MVRSVRVKTIGSLMIFREEMVPQENTVRIKLKFKLWLPLSHCGLRDQETGKSSKPGY